MLFIGSLASCTEDHFWNNIQNDKGVSVTFSLVTPDPTKVATEGGTRSTYENHIGNVFLLVFDENDIFIEYQQANETSGAYNFMASLTPQNRKCKLYVVANAPIIMDAKKDTWQEGVTTLDVVKQDLLKSRLPGSGNGITEVPAVPPLVSTTPVELNKIDKTMTIPNIILMERSTSKLTVSVTASDFVLDGANLCNAPVQGYVFGGMNVSSIPKAEYWGTNGSGSYSLEYMIRRASTDNPLYCYESPASNNTFLIIKATYKGVEGYYRINLKNSEDGSQLSLQRNYWYIVNIKKVQTAGFRTAAEAKLNTALNDMPGADVEVDVTDSYSHDIVSNGIQYLGVSNSELVVNRSGDISNMLATVLNYTVPGSGWSEGTITVNGSGLTLANGSTSDVLPVTTTSDREIKINMTPSSVGGTLTFRIGDLYKVVTIVRDGELPAVVREFKFEDISMADKSLSSDVVRNNVAFSTVEGVYPNYDDRLFSPGGDMFIKIEPNAGFGAGLSKRSGEFYLAHSNDRGKIKFVYTQDFLNVDMGKVQIRPYTYVGTFHRWNETAERIIRIKAVDPDPNKTWTAIVVQGNDFIELDTTRSSDSGITLYPYGFDESNPTDCDNANYRTAQQVEDNCQFTPQQKGKSVVHGRGNLIYFRVGMKSKLPSSTSKPRYGLIALIHSKGNHLIYVRQGEEPDYLMRDRDGINRPEAIKISPYNLTIPVPGSGSRWPQYYDVPQNGGAFVDYPSKGGYLFFGDDFYRGYRTYGFSWSSPPSRPNNNLCPWGRIPNDGVSDKVNYSNTGFIVNSEIRQSIWLYPANDFGKTNHGNMLRGYIADGWYDRRKMRYPNANSPLYQDIYRNDPTKDGSLTYQGVAYDESNPKKIEFFTPTVVDEIEGEDMAFAGMLLYNPYNFASIFIPATGSVNRQMSNRFQGMGAESNIWTSTYAKNFQNYTPTEGISYLSTGYYSGWGVSGVSSFVLDTWVSPGNGSMDAFSIRCVRK